MASHKTCLRSTRCVITWLHCSSSSSSHADSTTSLLTHKCSVQLAQAVVTVHVFASVHVSQCAGAQDVSCTCCMASAAWHFPPACPATLSDTHFCMLLVVQHVMPQLASLPGPAVINTGKADIKPGKTLRLRHATTRSATCLVLLVPFVSTKLSEQTSLAANPLLTTARCRGHQVS